MIKEYMFIFKLLIVKLNHNKIRKNKIWILSFYKLKVN